MFIPLITFYQIFDEMDDLIRNEAEIGTHVTYHLFESIRQFYEFESSQKFKSSMAKFESSMATDYGYGDL